MAQLFVRRELPLPGRIGWRSRGFDSHKVFRRVRELVGYMPEHDCIFFGLKGIEAVAYADVRIIE